MMAPLTAVLSLSPELMTLFKHQLFIHIELHFNDILYLCSAVLPREMIPHQAAALSLTLLCLTPVGEEYGQSWHGG